MSAKNLFKPDCSVVILRYFYEAIFLENLY